MIFKAFSKDMNGGISFSFNISLKSAILASCSSCSDFASSFFTVIALEFSMLSFVEFFSCSSSCSSFISSIFTFFEGCWVPEGVSGCFLFSPCVSNRIFSFNRIKSEGSFQKETLLTES